MDFKDKPKDEAAAEVQKVGIMARKTLRFFFFFFFFFSNTEKRSKIIGQFQITGSTWFKLLQYVNHVSIYRK